MRRQSHNHGPDQGPGIACPEHPVGACLVVINPEDREQVERLVWAIDAACVDQFEDAPSTPGEIAESLPAMQAALRSLIAPSKPEEPQGLGAVVEDANGHLWANLTDPNCSTHTDPWVSVHDPERWLSYADIAAVRVLSEGVTA